MLFRTTPNEGEKEMLNFLQLDSYRIINMNEIMYIDIEYDNNNEIKYYHIVMKDQQHFLLPVDYSESVLQKIKEWAGIIEWDS